MGDCAAAADIDHWDALELVAIVVEQHGRKHELQVEDNGEQDDIPKPTDLRVLHRITRNRRMDAAREAEAGRN